MLEFIHAADIHLDSPLRGLERYEGAPVEEIRLATRRALENLVNLAIQRRVAFVLLAGDLFDGDWRDYNTGLFFARQMARLNEEAIPVYIVKGNHDAANKMTRSLRMPENVHIFGHTQPETFLLDEHNVAIHGQSFSTSAVQQNLAQGYPEPVGGRFNIGVLHTCATGREGHERYAPCSISDMVTKKYDYWALGHVHNYEVLNRDPLIIFPGNIQGRHIRETGPKGCAVVTIDERGKAEERFEALDVLRWEHCVVDVSEVATASDIVEMISETLNEVVQRQSGLPTAVRIEITGETEANTELRADSEHWTNQIRACAIDCARDGIWIEKVKIRTSSRGDSAGLADGPLERLLGVVREHESDSERLAELRADLQDFEKKLPSEVKELMGWKDDSFLDDALKDVEDILLTRLGKAAPKA